MVASLSYDEILAMASQDVKDVFFVPSRGPLFTPQELELTISDENSFTNRIQKLKQISQEITLETNFSEIIGKVVSIMHGLASLSYKGSKFLEPSEVKTINDALENRDGKIEKITELKKELEQFEEQIQINYSLRICEQKKERLYFEYQIDMLENEKKQIVKENLSKTLWPYDSRTKRYDCRISLLKIKMAKCTLSLAQLTGMRPAASEKDILLFQIQLKNKFTAQASII